MNNDPVNHPAHYQAADDPAGTYEAINVIEAHALGFHLGNVIKYTLRADKGGTRLRDLRKAQWYLARAIAKEASRAGVDAPPPHVGPAGMPASGGAGTGAG